MYRTATSSCSCDEVGQEKAPVAMRSCRWCCNVTALYRRRLSELCSHLRSARSFTLPTLFVGSLSRVLKMLQLSSSSAVTLSRGSCKLLNIRLGGLLPCSEAGEAGEAAEVDDLTLLIIDHGCAACHWSTGALECCQWACGGSFKMYVSD